MEDEILKVNPSIRFLGKIKNKKSVIKVCCILCGEKYYTTPNDLLTNIHKCKKTSFYKENEKNDKKYKDIINKIKKIQKKAKLKSEQDEEKEAIKKEFERIRRKILKRDNYKCVECGSDEKLNVHHIIQRSKGGDNSESNLVTLCLKCHAEKHKGEQIYNLMKSRLNKTLNRKVGK